MATGSFERACTGLCAYPEKTQDSPNLSFLADLEFLHKPEVKALAKLSNASVKGILQHTQNL